MQNSIKPPVQTRQYLDFMKYSKIQDILLYFGDLVVKMNVVLYKDISKKGKVNFHRETEYMNPNTLTIDRNITRSYDCFLTIENIAPIVVNGKSIKDKLCVRGGDIYLFKMAIAKKIFDMISDPDRYGLDDRGKLSIVKQCSGIGWNIGMNGTLDFIPGIKYSTYTQESYPCVDIIMNNNPNNVSKVYLSQMYEFLHILDSISLHQYASELINYLGRPDYGTNMYSMIDAEAESNKLNSMEGVQKRILKPNTNKSYFEK